MGGTWRLGCVVSAIKLLPSTRFELTICAGGSRETQVWSSPSSPSGHGRRLSTVKFLYLIGRSRNSSTGRSALCRRQVVSHPCYRRANGFDRLSAHWYKTILTAAEAPGNRYHFEGLSGLGSALDVSDGTTEWVYLAAVHAYTRKAASCGGPTMPKALAMLDTGPTDARDLRKSIAELGKRYKSATRLPDETVSLEGRTIPSMVVRVTSADLKNASAEKLMSEETIWIDRTGMVVVKRLKRSSKDWNMAGINTVMKEEYLSTYPTTELDVPTTDTSLFSFLPPLEASLVDTLPSPTHWRWPDLGKAAPSLTLKSADGKQVTLASFRGKPVLIDLWATWCVPCVESLPRLARLYQQTRKTSLVMIAIDKDEDAKGAIDFLAKKNYTWPNFHDEGEAKTAFGASGIPRIILINAEGEIVYDAVGVPQDDRGDEDPLVIAVSKLGPEYAFLAAKTQPDPCVASKESQR
jgi:thiol-disulfide isomerase/thioredoxin